MTRSLGLVAVLLATMLSGPAAALGAAADGETVEQSFCRLIEAASRQQDLPVRFFTRLVWQESSFRADVTSRAGAQGIAQFMPGTARERGLADPFDPEQAIPAAASFLADLRTQFGNLGLAAAAYNAGPTRVAGWLAGQGTLPAETRAYVTQITGRSVEDWSGPQAVPEPQGADPQGCLQVTAALKVPGGGRSLLVQGVTAPWGVQLAGAFSKDVALRTYDRHRARLGSILGDTQPMVLGLRLRSRGRRTYYRIRVPAETRDAANALCARIHGAGGDCIVLRS